MTDDLVMRYVTKDGNTRINIVKEEYAENPRDTTDEPLHCEDWSRDYSIMNKQEQGTQSDSACSWIRYMLERYGNTKEIFKVLFENAKSDKHKEGDMALMYDKSRREWILNYWVEPWKDYNGGVHGNQWSEEVSFCCKIKDLTVWDIASYLSDEQVEVFADKKYFTDKIKFAYYNFGYYGKISFSEEFSTNSDGICWLEKDEFMKYSGCTEEYWKKPLTEIEWLCKEIEAWADDEVYGFTVETKANIRTTRENLDNGEKKTYDCVEWHEEDSCGGFYGKLNKANIENIMADAGYKLEELTEVDV